MTLRKINILRTVVVALVAGGIITYLSQSHPEHSPSVSKHEESRLDDKDQLARLEAENRQLADALDQANSDQQRLETAKQEAEQSADSYRQLAEKVQAENPTPLQSYPTPRHALVGFGKLALLTRSTMQLAKLPPEERTGAGAEKAKADMLKRIQEGLRLVQAMNELKMDQSWQEQKRTPEEEADQFTCFLHGVLDLNEQQFAQIDAALKNHYQMPGVERLNLHVAGPGVGTPRSPFQSLPPNTLQQIQNLLTPAQKETLQQFTTPQN